MFCINHGIKREKKKKQFIPQIHNRILEIQYSVQGESHRMKYSFIDQ